MAPPRINDIPAQCYRIINRIIEFHLELRGNRLEMVSTGRKEMKKVH